MLSVQNISAHYGFVQALRQVSLKVPKGDIVALLGSNGAGKSTVLKVISGLLRPSQGQVIYKGEDISKCPVADIVKRGIVQVPEGRHVFPELTVQENLLVGAYTRKDKNEVEQSIRELEAHFPVLGERRRQQAGTLSGGEQQMLAIARALISKPEILLLDEPSLGLAPLMVSEIFHIIRQIKQRGTTLLLVEQNAAFALKAADYAYVLETGRVVASGKAADIMHDEAVKQAYLGGKTK